ncbi:INTRADIOL-DIOXYGENAS domain-containing protein [Sulfidibacter corallicola]|uniref:Intradiol ring-cleavage dioxygenases domain-containing protein n=1 Tax=Sulfidibacter corallicola TaxID=2818388 RepID=A0A8A4TT42_SULCO|nr:protocatechuate 3,4-dioxygenase [Sulfidibacter corallicola]QTD49705.1 hypothetical protein J3U87_29325 [Sulfidibacter corallicola]
MTIHRKTEDAQASDGGNAIHRRAWLKATAASLATLAANTAIAGRPCATTVGNGDGPFYPDTEIPPALDLTRTPGRSGRATGQPLLIVGRVLDADCRPVKGARVEIWQADDRGRYHTGGDKPERLDPAFRYFAHAITDDAGQYRFKTLLPAAYQVGRSTRAPHIHYKVKHPDFRTLSTELYFEPHGDIRRQDGIFQMIPEHGRERLIVPLVAPATMTELADLGHEADQACRFDITIGTRA